MLLPQALQRHTAPHRALHDAVAWLPQCCHTWPSFSAAYSSCRRRAHAAVYATPPMLACGSGRAAAVAVSRSARQIAPLRSRRCLCSARARHTACCAMWSWGGCRGLGTVRATPSGFGLSRAAWTLGLAGYFGPRFSWLGDAPRR